MDILERVTKAISDAGDAWLIANPGDGDMYYHGWADVPVEVFARAAIEAMRAGDQSILDAAWRQSGAAPELRAPLLNYYRHDATLISTAAHINSIMGEGK